MPALRSVLARCRAAVPALLLAACAHRVATHAPVTQATASPPPLTRYVAPAPPQDAAPLTMHGDVPLGSYYTVDVLADTLTCRGHQRVGASAGPVDLSATTLATERWQTLEVTVNMPLSNRACTVRVTFAPRHGRSYQLAPKHANDSCYAFVFDTTDPQAPQIESSIRFRTSRTEDCVPLSRALTPRGIQEPQVSVSVQDLPTNPDTDALSPNRAPTKAPSGSIPDEAVTDGDLNGLTGH